MSGRQCNFERRYLIQTPNPVHNHDRLVRDGSQNPDIELVTTVWYKTVYVTIRDETDRILPPKKVKSLCIIERKVSDHTKQLFKETSPCQLELAYPKMILENSI